MNLRNILLIGTLGTALGLSALGCNSRSPGSELDAQSNRDAIVDVLQPDSSIDALVDASPDASPICGPETISFEYAPGQTCSITVALNQDGNLIEHATGSRIWYQEVDTDAPFNPPLQENFPVQPYDLLVLQKPEDQFIHLVKYIWLYGDRISGTTYFENFCTGESYEVGMYYDEFSDTYHGTLYLDPIADPYTGFGFRVFNMGLQSDLNTDWTLDGSTIEEFRQKVNCLNNQGE